MVSMPSRHIFMIQAQNFGRELERYYITGKSYSQLVWQIKKRVSNPLPSAPHGDIIERGKIRNDFFAIFCQDLCNSPTILMKC